MASLRQVGDITGGVPAGIDYLISGNGLLCIYNYGPSPLIANLVDATTPVPPDHGTPIPPRTWVMLPSDQENDTVRLGFAAVPLMDGNRAVGGANWDGMDIWVN